MFLSAFSVPQFLRGIGVASIRNITITWMKPLDENGIIISTYMVIIYLTLQSDT